MWIQDDTAIPQFNWHKPVCVLLPYQLIVNLIAKTKQNLNLDHHKN